MEYGMPRVSSKRQITLPIADCEALGIEPGDEVAILRHGNQFNIIKGRSSNDGIISKLLQACGRTMNPVLTTALYVIYYDISYVIWLDSLIMSQKAKLFMNGRSQAVRLPANFRFDCEEVYIRRDPETGDVVISRKPGSWESFFELVEDVDVSDDFMADRDNDIEEEKDVFGD